MKRRGFLGSLFAIPAAVAAAEAAQAMPEAPKVAAAPKGEWLDTDAFLPPDAPYCSHAATMGHEFDL